MLAVAVSPDRRLAASGGADRTVDVVDVATGKLVHRLPGYTDVVSSVATTSDGKRLATSTIDVRFSNRLLEVDESFAARYKNYFADDVSGSASEGANASDGGNAGRMQPGEVRIWTMADGRQHTMLPLPSCQVTAVAFIPNSDQLAVSGWLPGKGGMLSLWDTSGGKHLRDFAAQKAEVLSIAVSPDGRTLASADADGNLDLFDVQSGKKARSHKHDHAIEAVTFSPDGKLLASGDAKRTVRMFDVASGMVGRTLTSRSYIESLAFSPDGALLAAGTRDPGLELWDLRADTASRTLKVLGDHFASMPGYVAFSRDGRFVVCGGHGKDIAVFDVAKGTLQSELRGHAHASTAAVFLPDGRLISGGEERTVRLWDLNQGKCLVTWTVVPADEKQHWADEWVGFKPSGEFVGSKKLDRLVGWQTGGEVIPGPEDADRRHVESLFPAEASASPARVTRLGQAAGDTAGSRAAYGLRAKLAGNKNARLRKRRTRRPGRKSALV